MENAYKYLFPFEKIPQGAAILIYGAGILGQEYLKQIKITNYCKVVGFVDKNFKEYGNTSLPVYAPTNIRELKFDRIVVALRSCFYFATIKDFLNSQGVEDEKIICVFERNLPLGDAVACQNNDSSTLSRFATVFASISIAIFMTGGIGDMVTYKRFLEEIHQFVPDAKMDIFTVRGLEFLQWLYSETDYINGIFPDLGKNYNDNKKKYSLGISCMGAGFLSVDYFSETDLKNVEDFLCRIKRLDVRCRFENFSFNLPVAVMFYRRIFNEENCYTGFNYRDVFSIRDKQIKIPSSPQYEKKFIEIGLGNYITINTGNGVNNNAVSVAKSWPVEYFQKVAKMFKQCYPNIKIVQIGLLGEPQIEDADRYFMGESFGLVAQILKNAIFHLDIEGGLVHLASQLGTKCVVLFGPTLAEYNAYDNNINIKVGNCHGCYGLYLDINHCARHLEKPKCMYGITPEIVMRHINEYMEVWRKNVCKRTY